MKKIFTPLAVINAKFSSAIILGWLFILIGFWSACGISDVHLFPTPIQVLTGFSDLWEGGLIVHIVSSLWLCFISVMISIVISLILAYSSTIEALKPIGTFVSKLRYLPLTGISFYISLLVNDARAIQVWVLVMFMTTFLTTSLMQMIKDIPDEEFGHARTLGCSRLETIWEVIIKGRFDYVFELVRQNLAIVWMMLVSIESILIAAGGLGTLIKNGDRLGDNGKTIAVQIIIVLIGLVIDFTLTKIRKTIFRYSNY